MQVGVLALQGSVREHLDSLKRCGATAVEVRTAEQLNSVSGLIIPGGESTTVAKLLRLYGLMDLLQERGRSGFPIFGTCTGMILLAREIEGSDQSHLGLMDITVRRNAYGRQVDSFETEITIEKVADPDRPIPAIFIRAPLVTQVGEGVDVLASVDSQPVMLRQGNLLAASFHPELTDDTRVHGFFIEEMIEPATG